MTRASTPTTPPAESFAAPRTAEVWGLPLAFLTLEETLDAVDALIAAGRPSYFITANLFYAMLTDQHPDMDAINRGAAFVLADGMPLVWASRYKGGPLPERVAGSDLIFRLSERAAGRGHRLFLLGVRGELARSPPGCCANVIRGSPSWGSRRRRSVNRPRPKQP